MVPMRNTLIGSNALDPSRMTTPERLDEVARLLAAGILRARRKANEGNARNINTVGEVSLDFTAPQRGHVSTKRRRGETR